MREKKPAPSGSPISRGTRYPGRLVYREREVPKNANKARRRSVGPSREAGIQSGTRTRRQEQQQAQNVYLVLNGGPPRSGASFCIGNGFRGQPARLAARACDSKTKIRSEKVKQRK
ncbi:hypothetical protein MRX96_015446 [Rhipicephalus microplus]